MKSINLSNYFNSNMEKWSKVKNRVEKDVMSEFQSHLETINNCQGREKIGMLEDLLIKYKHLYYSGKETIPDQLYDKLEDELRVLDSHNPVLEMVGFDTTGEKVPHDKKMLSLGKTYKEDELLTWVENKDVVSTFKYDGVSGSLIYENGILTLGKTRGDGSFGENITAKITWIDSLPKKLNSKTSLDQTKIEVRGEIYCKESDFFQLSQKMEEIGLDKPSSLRNIVAGIVSRKDNIDLAKYLSFAAFDLVSDDLSLKTEVEKFKMLESFGFNIPDFFHHEKKSTLGQSLSEAKKFMEEGDYLIDGLVFTYNNLSLHDELGATAHHPRYKMAFKFQGESVPTIINSISWQVSRNGFLTPVANVEPVALSGAKISRVTLHNYGLVNEFKLKKGDKIEIIRSGEVIPKFISVLEQSKEKFIIPESCPSCETKLKIEDIRLVCPNKKCPAILKEGILNFIQKIGIDDLSSKRLDEFLGQGLIKNISDLYKLKEAQLLKLDKVKEKLATKILNNIEKSKNVSLITFLSALGISGGAYNKCEKVVDAGFDTIEKIKALKVEELTNVDSFALKSATDFIESLNEKNDLINELGKLGFDFKKDTSKTGKLANKKLCITGALSEKRSVIEKSIRDAGGAVVGSVSKNLDYLVTNEVNSNSSKFKKATDLGISMISEAELLKLLS